MPALTKEQWKQVEHQLSGPFGEVKLKADGYNLTLQVRGYSALRQCIVVFVDGVSKGEWWSGEAPEAKKFCRERRRWLYGTKLRNEAKLKLKSRRLDAYMRKTCTDVEVVSLGYRGG